jgi:antitoxin (DNA-binding transcriptional repressor) of toxin-antitoxin stability system
MKKAGIVELKKNLSRYLNYVKSGETVLVVDRNIPLPKLYLCKKHRGAHPPMMAALRVWNAKGLFGEEVATPGSC